MIFKEVTKSAYRNDPIFVFVDYEGQERYYDRQDLEFLIKDSSHPYYQEFLKALNLLKQEYIVNVEWFYDIMPSNKHRKDEHITASSPYDAASKVERKYPNAHIHSVTHKA